MPSAPSYTHVIEIPLSFLNTLQHAFCSLSFNIPHLPISPSPLLPFFLFQPDLKLPYAYSDKHSCHNYQDKCLLPDVQ
jgi:hypothetical protein